MRGKGITYDAGFPSAGTTTHEPFDTEYGLREFAYVDVDGTLHRVGSRTLSAS